MKRWLGLFGILALATAVAVGIARWNAPSAERCAKLIRRGMSVEEIRAVVGSHEDAYSTQDSATGQHERTWYSVGGWGHLTVVFDQNGGAAYIDLAPPGCGNTPLMETTRSIYTREYLGDELYQVYLDGLAAPPPLTALNRFPTLAATDAQIDALIRVRYQLRQAPPSRERDQAVRHNGHQLAAWELLLEARGGLAVEEGGRDDEETCRRALGRLRELLGEKEWRAGRMP